MRYRLYRVIRKCFFFVVVLIVVMFSSILFASAVLELWGKRVQDIETLYQIEKIERQKLKIRDNVKITFIFNNNWGILDSYRKRGGQGLTYLSDETNKNFTIYLRKPSSVSIVRHEIYHAYRLSNTRPPYSLLKEQFLAYIYGLYKINLEFLFGD